MKKIFKIASYDFKRLMLNPITIITMLVVLIFCLIFSVAYKIPTTPAYTASVSGTTAKQIHTNFNSTSTEIDTKGALLVLVDEAENMIFVQKSCADYGTLSDINEKFNSQVNGIANEVERYGKGLGSTYIDNNNVDEIKLASQELKDFVERYKNLDVFESNMIFTKDAFQDLENVSKFLYDTAHSGESVSKILDKLWAGFDNFKKLDNVVKNGATTWIVSSEKLDAFQAQYIDKAKSKLATIEAEMISLSNAPTSSTTPSEMQSLVTNFKLTCESAKNAIVFEFYLLLNNHFKSLKNLHKYEPIIQEETTIALTKIGYFLDDESEYYSQHQVPLNFNTASYQVTAYDKTYLMMSIIGFFTILFGIFVAYKLFGSDRKNGKMDLLLSQDVSYGQVFAGKFLATILSTTYVLGVFLAFNFAWALFFHHTLPNEILAVFNLSNAYTIHPFLFLIIKIAGIELQVIFYSIITIFLMNLSRKFELTFGIAVGLFVVATICNIFLNGTLVYALFPFIHADLTCFLGGGMMNAGFLQTPLYAYGNFFISLVYYLVVVALLYNFTNQLFKKN